MRRAPALPRSRSSRAVLAGVLALAVAAATLAGCSNGPPPIRVGAVYPLDGSQGLGGLDEFRGVQLAADLVNDQGGVDGRPIDLLSVNTPTSDAAPGAVDQLRSRGARFVLGSNGSTISAPAAATAARHDMLYWETGAVGEMTGEGAGSLVFRMSPSGEVLGRTAIRFVADEAVPKLGRNARDLRYAVVNVHDAYGSAVARGAVQQIHEQGLPFAGRFSYDLHRFSARRVVARIARAEPDVLFVSAYLHDGVAIRRQLVRRHVPLVANIGSSSSYCMQAFGSELGQDAVGLFASDKPSAGSINPDGLAPAARSLLRAANARYRDRYGSGMDASALAGFSNAYALFHDVMPRANTLDPAAVSRAALATELPPGSLPNGSGMAFSAPGGPDPGDNLRAASVIWQWMDVGWEAVVWPKPYATEQMQPIRLAT
jgi:branched-chain amino acid transport system substrate-binding protein